MFKKLMVISIILIPFFCGAKEYIFPFFSFPGSTQGENPKGAGLLFIDDYIYSTTYGGGLHDAGTIYRIKKSGKEYEILHHFTGNTGIISNSKPRGELLHVDGVIYGTCFESDRNYGGLVYSINTDGTGFKILADFYDGSGSYVNGKHPGYGGLTLVDGVLYGSTSGGGNGNGVLFSLNTDGSNFRVIYKFPADGATGEGCYTGLTYREGRLFGATLDGGSNSAGTIFSINPDGTDIRVLRNLNASTDGSDILSPLIIIEDTIYIAPYDGGTYSKGTIISMKTDGTDFKVLHHFNTGDGKEPGIYGSLIEIGDYLYGATNGGGGSNHGVLYRIKKDGSVFEALDYFDDDKGRSHKGEMVFEPPYIYGSTRYGGVYGHGTLWAYHIGFPFNVVTYTPEPGLTTAKLWGNAYKKDDFEVLEKGFCWGLNSNPDLTGDYKIVGTGAGKFVADIYSLMPGKTYHVRAYIKNKMGTFYGEDVTFISLNPKVSGTVTMDGKPVAGVTVDFVGRETFVTGPSGTFSTEVYYGWTGTIQLSKEGYTFTPDTYNGSNVKENISLTITANKTE